MHAMIITPDDKASEELSNQKTREDDPQQSPDEPPPSYSLQAGPIASGSATAEGIPAFKTKPTNFLAVSTRDNAIRGEFVIDPSIRIPPSMLPPLGEGQTEADRKNLSLASEQSSVNAEIWLLAHSSTPTGETGTDKRKPQRTAVALNSDHGSIRVQLHAIEGAHPFVLTARAPHGSVRIALPRSFQGLLSLSTRDSISVSDSLIQNATQLSQVGDTRRYFVGDFQMLGEDEWEGDQLTIEATHGCIRVKYVDEVAEAAQGKRGLFGRLFGK